MELYDDKLTEICSAYLKEMNCPTCGCFKRCNNILYMCYNFLACATKLSATISLVLCAKKSMYSPVVTHRKSMIVGLTLLTLSIIIGNDRVCVWVLSYLGFLSSVSLSRGRPALPAAALTKTLIIQHTGPQQANAMQQISTGVCAHI